MLAPTSRRQFLKNACATGIALSLETSLPQRVIVDPCDQFPFLSILDNPQLVEMARNGMAPLWVAGQTLNSFASHLHFINLPSNLTSYLKIAGGDWKGLLQAKGLWETIPAEIRAGGPKETLRFLNGKDWSHIVPRSQGGPTTADNGIFELKLLNRSRGAKIMTSEEIAAAKAVIRSDVVVSVVRQTLGAMAKGAIISVIFGGLFACLECGLQYAERKISWEQMVTKIIKGILFAGGLAFVITGVLVGLGLLFPGLIPILTLSMFVIQIVGLVFLAKYAITLGKRYWALLEKHGLIDEACQMLGKVEELLREKVDELEQSVTEKVFEWLRIFAMWFTGHRADGVVKGLHFKSGSDTSWLEVATQTQVVSRYASEIVSPLRVRGYAFDRHNLLRSLDLPDMNLPQIIASLDELKEQIVRTVKCEFTEALRTTCLLRMYFEACLASSDLKSGSERGPYMGRCLGPVYYE